MLNNQSLMLLSKFALKAKKHLGLIKVMQMINSEQYAYKTLTQAALTDDKDLVDLTKRICHELHVGMDVVDAIDMYIESIKAINNDEDYLHEVKYFLIKLTTHLYGIFINGETYRHAVDKVLLNVDDKERANYITLARKFYGFWKIKNGGLSNKFNPQNEKVIAQKEEFIKLWASIDHEFLTNVESWPLNLYVESIRQRGLMEEEINICRRVAKVVIIELRSEQNSDENAYRNVIDNIQILFERDDLKGLFLTVSRDFYHFWMGTDSKVAN